MNTKTILCVLFATCCFAFAKAQSLGEFKESTHLSMSPKKLKKRCT